MPRGGCLPSEPRRPGPQTVPGGPPRCCHAHDCCYGRLEKQGCEPKLERYLFSANRHRVVCGK